MERKYYDFNVPGGRGDPPDEVKLRIQEQRMQRAEAAAPAIIPRLTLEALTRYAVHQIPTGGFLRAVLENKLLEAVQAADGDNLAAFVPIVQYVFNNLPAGSWGSPQVVRAWIQKRKEREQRT